jgi:hypothetical protein
MKLEWLHSLDTFRTFSRQLALRSNPSTVLPRAADPVLIFLLQICSSTNQEGF